MDQMCFSGLSNCPTFRANPFRKNICSLCQCKIQDHSGASQADIATAIEYSADHVPSKILQTSGTSFCLYMGGMKSAVNLEFLQNNQIKLIICAAKDLGKVFGPKYEKMVEKRNKNIPDLKVVQVDWVDTIDQKLCEEELKKILQTIYQCPFGVLVHCAQGKSRSGVICISFLAMLNPTVGIEDIAKQVKSKREMAEANHGFMQQLHQLQKDQFFINLHNEFVK